MGKRICKLVPSVKLLQALNPLGIGVATGEHCQNRVMFKQLMQAKGFNYCQTDSCRIGGINELIAVYLMAAKFKSKPYSFQHLLKISIKNIPFFSTVYYIRRYPKQVFLV